MKDKLTVMEKYSVVKAMLNGEYKGEMTVAQAVAFIDNRMEQTAKKNASKSGEPTKADKEKMARHTAIENEVVGAMEADVKYTVSDLLKRVSSVESTQMLTPRLTALVTAGRVAKTEEKGRSYYTLVPSVDAE